MKKTGFVKGLALLLVLCMLSLCACSTAGSISGSLDATASSNGTAQPGTVTGTPLAGTTQAHTPTNSTAPNGAYKEGVVLVKYDGAFTETMLAQLDFVSAEPLYKGSSWHTVTLGESMNTIEAVEYLTELGCFDAVDYDYVMKADGEVESVDISGNTYAEDLTYLDTLGVKKGWENNANNKKNPGGSPDVIIAIIDTGVDYNHLDLRNNIWVNPAEIPDNGIDDDNNGYIDDIYGWDCVGDDNDPMDDNGHGTHVAGIAAAENNKMGTVGIAYNCKIMVLKAGNSSGYFNNSDIAEAIQYAYMNGASVINMSFGGSNISIAVEEALENAYNTCVLVAAAGNESACNQSGCMICFVKPTFPAALTYVIGVMSCNASGTSVSSFSNYDHYPYNTFEYEVFACGESIPSTWPGNKYATLSGTSMAAPTVSGIAALLRSAYPDREVYSTKYLQSQIVNTGELLALEKSVANAYDALTKLPTPKVNFYDYSVNDSISISSKNNGNGVIDAGETVRLSIALQNRGGVASNVNVSIDTMRNNDPSLTDPYFTFVNTTMTLSDIGTYSIRESGDETYFEILVSDDCPNDYLINFNIRFTYTNGMDEDDDTIYEDDGRQQVQFSVSKGYHLPSIINEDTVFTNDRHYIVGDNVMIPEGVTVTFEEGCKIQFYDDREYYNSPVITVYGNLVMQGTSDNMIAIFPNEQHANYICKIVVRETGISVMDYVQTINVFVQDNSSKKLSSISNSDVRIDYSDDFGYLFYYDSGYDGIMYGALVEVNSISHSYIELGYNSGSNYAGVHTSKMHNNTIRLLTMTNSSALICTDSFENNIVYTEPLKWGDGFGVLAKSLRGTVKNNKFIAINDEIESLAKFEFLSTDQVSNNHFSEIYQTYASQVIDGYYDNTGKPIVDVYGACSDASKLWPHVVRVELFDKNGNPITTVGKEDIKVRVTFNRPMDKNAGTFLTFGTIEPYADYRIDGEWVSDIVWEGTYTLKAQIENGQNFLKVNNACAADDPTKTVFGEYHLYEFTIDTTAAMSMNLLATPTEDGINLTWAQDEYDTLLGYNIYRAEEKDGNYVKLNPTILLSTDESFLDENAEPGKTYWYTYTVVLSDFTESNPAGRVFATAMDTMAPSIYHTPVNQGYENNNLVISCTASDNVAITGATLYYRATGEVEWKTMSMVKSNDKYSATIFGSEVTLAGLEYYIVVSDGRNTIAKGNAETPYTVVVKDASAISRLGDVDGDGVVTTKDALMLMQCLNEDIILTDDEFKRADLNGDGTLSSVEALRILQYINGNVTTLEM